MLSHLNLLLLEKMYDSDTVKKPKHINRGFDGRFLTFLLQTVLCELQFFFIQPFTSNVILAMPMCTCSDIDLLPRVPSVFWSKATTLRLNWDHAQPWSQSQPLFSLQLVRQNASISHSDCDIALSFSSNIIFGTICHDLKHVFFTY